MTVTEARVGNGNHPAFGTEAYELARLRSIFFDSYEFVPDFTVDGTMLAVKVGFIDRSQMHVLGLDPASGQGHAVCCALGFDQDGGIIAATAFPDEFISKTRDLTGDKKWEARRQQGIILIRDLLEERDGGNPLS